MHRRRPSSGPKLLPLALLAAGATIAACRAGEEPPAATVAPPITAVGGAPRVDDQIDAQVVDGGEAWLTDGDRSSIEDGRLARIDARLLDLQAIINQLDGAGADRAACESRWEELDGRRSSLRREAKGLDDEVTATDRAERRRALAQDLDDLESDLEAAVQEVEARLARG